MGLLDTTDDTKFACHPIRRDDTTVMLCKEFVARCMDGVCDEATGVDSPDDEQEFTGGWQLSQEAPEEQRDGGRCHVENEVKFSWPVWANQWAELFCNKPEYDGQR
jgi:hypothetical protein